MHYLKNENDMNKIEVNQNLHDYSQDLQSAPPFSMSSGIEPSMLLTLLAAIFHHFFPIPFCF